MSFSPLITQLINALRCLPGVGPKSAQRMAFHVLERERAGGLALAKALEQAINLVGRCERCRTLSETLLCSLCSCSTRDSTVLCVVETPADVLAIEQTGCFHGYYYVLMGRISPLDGIGPEELGIDQFLKTISDSRPVEVILATNPTVEGEATAHYLAGHIKSKGINTSRLALGIPFGGELEYIDGNTLARALNGRESV